MTARGVDREFFVAKLTTVYGEIAYQHSSREKAVEAVRRNIGKARSAKDIRVYRYVLAGTAGRAVARPKRG